MANIINAAYVERHRQNVHNYESFGRAVSELLLRTAEESLNKSGPQAGSVTFNADVSIAPIVAASASGAEQSEMLSIGCISVEIHTPIGSASIHVGL